MTSVALGLAIASLAVARSPTFDVWSWLVWGREIAHGDLVTTWGPQFKPLPVAVATLAAPLGSAAVPIWIVVARTAGLLAVGAAARLAWRAAGPVAAAIAAVSLVSVHLFAVYLMPFGMSEPMLVAFVLWAADRHLEGRGQTAFVLLVGASLLRVETWPFLLAYAILLYRRRSARPVVIAALLLLVPAAWFLPEWWGSGHPFRIGNGQAVPGDPTSKAHPGLAVLSSSFDDVLTWVWAGALLGLAWAIRTRNRFLLELAGIGTAWLIIVAVMAEAGVSSGVARYLIVSHSVACVLCGVGWVALARKAASLVGSRLPRRATAARLAAALAVAALAVPSALTLDGWLRTGAKDISHQQGAYEATARAIEQAGGGAVLNRCGTVIWTRTYREPQVAWLLDRHLADVTTFAVPGLPAAKYASPMVRVVDRPGDPLLPDPFRFEHYREVGSSTSHGVPAVVLTPC